MGDGICLGINISRAENGFVVNVTMPSTKETATSAYGETKTYTFLTVEAVVFFVKEVLEVK